MKIVGPVQGSQSRFLLSAQFSSASRLLRRKRLPGIRASAGWRSVVPVLNAPTSIFSALGSRSWATLRERTSSSSSDLRIADTT